MQIVCDYQKLMGVLNNVYVVVEDTLSSPDLKNVIFRAHKDTGVVEVIGINSLITYRVTLEEGYYSTQIEDEEYNDSGVAEFQVKNKVVYSFLNTFKSTRRTQAKDVIFEPVKNKIRVTVIEADVNDEDKTYKSNLMSDNVAIRANMLSSINLEMPEDEQLVDIPALMLYTSSLLPIMQNGTNMYAKMAFGGSNVVAFNPTTTVLMKNWLGDMFSNFCLTYQALTFIKTVVCQAEGVSVAKTADRICFRMGNSVAFIRYDKQMPNCSVYEKMVQKDHAIVLDRQYFKDVLKRLSLENESIFFTINAEEGFVEVKNSTFNQTVPILQTKGMSELGKVSFKVLPEVLNRDIIGDDNSFSEVVFMYLSPMESGGYTLILADDSGSWCAISRIR